MRLWLWILSWFPIGSTARLNRRLLFRFFDGARWQYRDPYALWRAIRDYEHANIQELYQSEAEGTMPETSRLCEALADVFEVDRFQSSTHRGMSDWELLQAFEGFLAYMWSVKKNGNMSAISSPTTEPPESSTTTEVPPETN